VTCSHVVGYWRGKRYFPPKRWQPLQNSRRHNSEAHNWHRHLRKNIRSHDVMIIRTVF
jgi:hypothetical protein